MTILENRGDTVMHDLETIKDRVLALNRCMGYILKVMELTNEDNPDMAVLEAMNTAIHKMVVGDNVSYMIRKTILGE